MKVRKHSISILVSFIFVLCILYTFHFIITKTISLILFPIFFSFDICSGLFFPYCIMVIEWFEQRLWKHQCSIVIFRSGRYQASPPCIIVRKHFNFNSFLLCFCITYYTFPFYYYKTISLILFPIFFSLRICSGLFFPYCIMVIEWFEQRFMKHQRSIVMFQSGRCPV